MHGGANKDPNVPHFNSDACPGRGWGECNCEPASGGFACKAVPSNGKLVVPSCANSIPPVALLGCDKIKSIDLTQATSLQSADLGFLKNTPNLAEVRGLHNIPRGSTASCQSGQTLKWD